MRKSRDPTLWIILVEPGTVLRTLAKHGLARSDEVGTESDPTPTPDDTNWENPDDVSKAVAEPLPLDSLRQLTHMIERTSSAPVMLFCEEDTFRALAEGSGLMSMPSPGTPPAGDELLSAMLNAVETAPLQSPREEKSVGAWITDNLSARELEVLDLLAEGASNKQISENLLISPNTVYTHVRHIQGKLRTANRTQTALLAKTMAAQKES